MYAHVSSIKIWTRKSCQREVSQRWSRGLQLQKLYQWKIHSKVNKFKWILWRVLPHVQYNDMWRRRLDTSHEDGWKKGTSTTLVTSQYQYIKHFHDSIFKPIARLTWGPKRIAIRSNRWYDCQRRLLFSVIRFVIKIPAQNSNIFAF